MAKAIIYTRQSKHREESISHELQQSACENYARSKGYEVVRVVREKGRSGKTIAKRPEFQETTEAIKGGQADLMLVWRWSRFARNTTDGLITIRAIKDAGGRVECALEQVDNTAAGKFTLTMLLGLAEMESDIKSEQWKEALSSRLADNKVPSARQYFGYDKIKRSKDEATGLVTAEQYVINPRQAALLTEAYRMYNSGKGFSSIATYFNDQGEPPRRAEHWTSVAVRRLMDNPFATGTFRYGKNEDGTEILHKGEHPAIIDAGTWAVYQKKRNGYQLAPRSKATSNPLTGLVLCGRCGKSMTPNKSQRGLPVFRCRTRMHSGPDACTGVRIPVPEVSTKIWWWFGSHYEEWLAALPSNQVDEGDIALAEEGLRQARAELTELILNVSKYGLTDTQASEAMRTRKQAVETAESRLEDLLVTKGTYTGDSISELLDQAVEDVDPEQWKAAMNKALAGVVVLPDKTVMIVPRSETSGYWI